MANRMPISSRRWMPKPFPHLLVLGVVLFSLSSVAQELSPQLMESIPLWVHLRFEKPDLKDYVITPRINPLYQRGDFNGDGKLDIALWVKNRKNNKSGIVVIHRGTEKAYVIGAGNLVRDRAGKALWARENGGADFDVIDAWTVYEKGAVEQGVEEDSPPVLKGDALEMIKTESASGLLYWTGVRYAWYQQGD
jgi:hypothetical protein